MLSGITTKLMNDSSTTPWDCFKGFLFRLFPHHLVSRITYWATRKQSFLVPFAINRFVKFFNVDLHDAQIENIQEYKTFNEFFTRALKKDARPIDTTPDKIVCPCDGTISMHGPIEEKTLIQAKNKYFSIEDFCTSQCRHLDKFINGYFFTVYLSPRDYHRVHMPCTAQLLEMIYVPGRLFSVAPYAPKTIDKLFARNERVIPVFALEKGYMAVAMVGAVNVAAIEMTWSGLITPPHRSAPEHYDYQSGDTAIKMQRGEHMGTFNLGSTVVLMFSADCVKPLPDLVIQQTVSMGQPLGSIKIS